MGRAVVTSQAGFAAWAAMLLVSGCAGKGDAPAPDPAQGAYDALRAKVAEVVDDPRRKAAALSELDALFDNLDQLEGVVADRRKRMRRLNADYDARREDFEVLLNEVHADFRKYRESALGHHRKLVATLTPDELDQIMKLQVKALTGTLRELQAG